jgi:addiction module RelE/StbE family toxin
MVKVIWTDSAIQDLDDIGNHIAKDSERYAEVTVERLFNSVDMLENFPKAGKMVTEFENELIRELIRGSYRIVYRIIDDFRIDIITVHNCARLIENTYDFSEFDDDK